MCGLQTSQRNKLTPPMTPIEQKIREIAAGDWTEDPSANFWAARAALKSAVLLLDDAERSRQSRGRTIRELQRELRSARQMIARLKERSRDE